MNIAICDDEKECREKISNLIKKIGFYEVEQFESGENLLNSIDNGLKYDIIFLDIEMPKINGVETAKKIREYDTTTILFFITNYVNFVSDTFRVGAFQFLSKPIDENAFQSDFQRAIGKYKQDHNKFIIHNTSQEIVLFVKDIIYIEGYNRKLSVHTKEDIFEFKGKISEEERNLVIYDFVRCHQGFLVNMNYIHRIEKDKIILINCEEIPVSKRMRKDLLESFTNYLSRRIV